MTTVVVDTIGMLATVDITFLKVVVAVVVISETEVDIAGGKQRGWQ